MVFMNHCRSITDCKWSEYNLFDNKIPPHNNIKQTNSQSKNTAADDTNSNSNSREEREKKSLTYTAAILSLIT